MKKAIDRIPMKGEHIMFDSNGTFPSTDGKKYLVLGKDREIVDIENIETKERSQIIAKFTGGYNKYLFFA